MYQEMFVVVLSWRIDDANINIEAEMLMQAKCGYPKGNGRRGVGLCQLGCMYVCVGRF
jgi:hypothetical protein